MADLKLDLKGVFRTSSVQWLAPLAIIIGTFVLLPACTSGSNSLNPSSQTCPGPLIYTIDMTSVTFNKATPDACKGGEVVWRLGKSVPPDYVAVITIDPVPLERGSANFCEPTYSKGLISKGQTSISLKCKVRSSASANMTYYWSYALLDGSLNTVSGPEARPTMIIK